MIVWRNIALLLLIFSTVIRFHRFLFFLISLFLVAGAAFLATSYHHESQAEENVCHKITSAFSGVPDRFGAPYDVQTPSSLLMKASCSGNTVTMNVGDSSALTYVYHKGYINRPGSQSWDEMPLVGANEVANAWFPKSATSLFLLSDSVTANDPVWFVSYVCQWKGTGIGWKCGCRDAQCSQNYWNVQRIQRDSTSVSSALLEPAEREIREQAMALNASLTNLANVSDIALKRERALGITSGYSSLNKGYFDRASADVNTAVSSQPLSARTAALGDLSFAGNLG